MRSQPGFRFLAIALVAIAATCLVSVAQAGFLEQLESLQASAGVLHQFRFEGDSTGVRQVNNGTAGVNLLSAAGEGGTGTNEQGNADPLDDVPYSHPAGDVNAIGYLAGYDGAGVSQAYRPQQIPVGATANDSDEILAQRRSGAGLYIPSFTTPSMMTLETVIQPEAYSENLGASGSLHYVLQTRNGGNPAGRGYYLAQQSPDGGRGPVGTLTATVGHPFSGHAARPRVVGDYTDEGHWYYVALTFDLSNTAAPAVINAWAADLTAGGPLVQTVTNYTDPATTVSTLLVGTNGLAGVGMFVRPGTPVRGQEFFAGSIDNLAVYDRKLTAGDIGRHHRALTVPGAPEPTTLVLLALGGVAVAGLRRRSD